MKIAFPATGTDLSCLLDGRFGRAPRFLVVDSETNSYQTIENDGNADASQGAGIQSAQAVIAAGATAVVSVHFGPKAFQVFEKAGIKTLQADIAPISDLMDKFRQGVLPRMQGPDKAGHAG
ncbi:MAG TPA: NifB/NifX family molybdenum-iron cluster-binding protein [Fibrobacteria bacterium]|nr:NifB/NifX family molybdenum-iron cluster-binding protein [Fibrobacteria bacterium]